MNKKRINLKSIVLSIGLAIIVIAIAITIIIINGIGIGILKAKAPGEHKSLEVAALGLNKVHPKVVKLNQKHLAQKVLVGKVLKSELALNAGVVTLKTKDKLLTAKLTKLDRQQLVSELKTSKSLLLDKLNSDGGQLDLDSLQALLTLKSSLKTGLLDRVV